MQRRKESEKEGAEKQKTPKREKKLKSDAKN